MRLCEPAGSVALLPGRGGKQLDNSRGTAARLVPRVATGSRILGDSEMSSGDIIVLGGLAGVFCWTYLILPLVFYHS
jgi:hypothetical protein